MQLFQVILRNDYNQKSETNFQMSPLQISPPNKENERLHETPWDLLTYPLQELFFFGGGVSCTVWHVGS